MTGSDYSHERSKVLPLSALRVFFCSRGHVSALYGLYYCNLRRRILITVYNIFSADTFSPNLPGQQNHDCTRACIFQEEFPFRYSCVYWPVRHGMPRSRREEKLWRDERRWTIGWGGWRRGVWDVDMIVRLMETSREAAPISTVSCNSLF